MGGISNTTTEADLHKLFSDYGNVRATKIIADRGGASKGYGFVTFETEEEAKKLQDEVGPESTFIPAAKYSISTVRVPRGWELRSICFQARTLPHIPTMDG